MVSGLPVPWMEPKSSKDKKKIATNRKLIEIGLRITERGEDQWGKNNPKMSYGMFI